MELVISDAHQILPLSWKGADSRHSNRVRRSELAEMSHALHDQSADAGAETDAAVGGDDGAQHLPAAVRRRRYTSSTRR